MDKLNPTDSQICELVKNHLEKEYFSAVGEPVFTWTEEDDEVISSRGLPGDMDRPYDGYTVLDYKIENSEIKVRTAEEITVKVSTILTVESWSSDDEDYPDPHDEETEIFCTLEYDNQENQWYVADAQE